MARPGAGAVVVANGAEGEPVSFKDKTLLRRAPHLVLDGAALAAAALGAREVVVAVDSSAREEIGAVSRALDERRDRRLTWRASAVVVPSGFVTGEETALVSVLDGGPAKPTLHAAAAVRARASAARRRSCRTSRRSRTSRSSPATARTGSGPSAQPRSPGSALFTVSARSTGRGVYEAALGTPLRRSSIRPAASAAVPGVFLLGGFFGSWVDPVTPRRDSR